MERDTIISITGTPGVGKTTFSKILMEKLDIPLMDLKKFILDEKISDHHNQKYDSHIIDIKKLRNYFSELKQDGPLIIEGHLSHFLKPTHVILLRCPPKTLFERLRLRKYSEEKILENVESEFLEIIKNECEDFENFLELDTSKQIDYKKILDWLKTGGRQTLNPNWSENFIETLKK